MDVSHDDNDDHDSSPPPTGVFVPQTGEVRDDDTFKILVASDVHLGYCDNNPARENDSFNTFEEILQIANNEKVDFLLLGGDLFHENKPRPNVLHKTTDLLRKYCLGDRPVTFQYVGIPERDFPSQSDPEINYYNANINIGLPVFTIHGNHDDPIGTTKTSAVDQLAAAKLLNHFGQWENLNSITVTPVLLIKGDTKLALYGLGHLKDDRLHRLMHDGKVAFVGPAEEPDSWFNFFVLHQNRVKHGPKNYIPENFIPGFIHLVLWGHEHECRLNKGGPFKGVEKAEGLKKTMILQPGSSVATSLGAGEAEEKHVALVKVNGKKFLVEPVKLHTVRPFVTKDLMAKDVFEKMAKNSTAKERSRTLEKYVEKMVESMIKDAEDQLTGHEKQPEIPLIRVRIFHDDVEDTFNPIRFGQRFADKVANDDIVLFKKTPIKREDGAEVDADEIGQMIMDHDDDDLDGHVETIVETYFANARAQNNQKELLEVLSERGLSEAVKCAVEKDDDKAIAVVIESQIEKAIQYLVSKQVTEETVEDVVDEFRELRTKMAEKENKEVAEMLNNIRPKNKPSRSTGDDDEEEDADATNGHDEDGEESPEIIDDDDMDDAPPVSRSRGGRGGRGTRGRGSSNGRGRGARGKTANRDESMSPPPAPSTSRGRGRGGRGSRGARGGSKESGGKSLVQTTLKTALPIRKSPRKGNQAMTFDDDDSD